MNPRLWAFHTVTPPPGRPVSPRRLLRPRWRPPTTPRPPSSSPRPAVLHTASAHPSSGPAAGASRVDRFQPLPHCPVNCKCSRPTVEGSSSMTGVVLWPCAPLQTHHLLPRPAVCAFGPPSSPQLFRVWNTCHTSGTELGTQRCTLQSLMCLDWRRDGAGSRGGNLEGTRVAVEAHGTSSAPVCGDLSSLTVPTGLSQAAFRASTSICTPRPSSSWRLSSCSTYDCLCWGPVPVHKYIPSNLAFQTGKL